VVTVEGGLDLGWGTFSELAVEAFVVEPRHPAAGGDLEVVECRRRLKTDPLSAADF